MVAANLKCVVVTPERAVLEEMVEFVAVPMFDGEMGILPGRAAVIGRLGYGELRTKGNDGVQKYYVDGGFLQVRDNVVTVLTERAIPQAELSVEKATADLEAAKTPGKTADEQQELTAKQNRARARLRIAKRKE